MTAAEIESSISEAKKDPPKPTGVGLEVVEVLDDRVDNAVESMVVVEVSVAMVVGLPV